MQTFDAIVLGTGTMGSFTCLELARRGLRVAGFDSFAPPHSRGSHSGDTRVFRIAYAEHPDYVPLAQRAGELWERFGAEFGKPLLTRSGLLSLGPAEGTLLSGTRTSAALHHLEVEELPSSELHRRYPAFAVPENYVGIFEKTAGWLDVPASMEGAQAAAEAAGAVIFHNTPVAAWKLRGSTVTIETADASFETERLIVTAGAGAVRLLSDLRLPLSIERKVLVWIDPQEPEAFAPGRFPVFAIEDNFFYGFPDIAKQGVKLAIHWEKGHRLEDPTEEVRPPSLDDYKPVLEMAASYLPTLAGPLPQSLGRIRRAATCLYTMTPDEHFLLDRHPAHPNICFAAGFSGHGFKFAPAIAEALADLATHAKPTLPIDFLKLNRIAQGHPDASTA